MQSPNQSVSPQASLESVTVLGATGSIGISTLDVLSRHPDRYSVFALTADRKWQILQLNVCSIIRDMQSSMISNQLYCWPLN